MPLSPSWFAAQTGQWDLRQVPTRTSLIHLRQQSVSSYPPPMPGALFVNIPARGHIHPTLPVVADLVGAGEPVTYCLPAEDESLILATGARFRPVGNNLPEARARKGGAMSLAELPAAAVRGAIRTLPELLDVVADVRPSYVVYDAYCYAGRLVAQLAGLPAVATYATYGFNVQALGSGAFGSLSSPSSGPSSGQRTLPGFEEAVAELVQRFGVGPPTLFDLLLHAEPLNLVFLPREFQPAGDSFDDSWVFVGPSMGSRGETADLPLGEGRRPTFRSAPFTTSGLASSGRAGTRRPTGRGAAAVGAAGDGRPGRHARPGAAARPRRRHACSARGSGGVCRVQRGCRRAPRLDAGGGAGRWWPPPGCRRGPPVRWRPRPGAGPALSCAGGR